MSHAVSPFKIVVAAPALLGWGAFASVLAQTESVPGGTSVVISGVAASAASAALAYMARQLASGNLVHRSTAEAERRYEELAKKSTAALEDSSKREEVYVQMLVRRATTTPGGPGGQEVVRP